MIIEKKESNMIAFGELDAGEIFSYEEKVYLVIDECYFGSYNAINLGNGEFCYFNYYELVKHHAYARLILEDKERN